MLLTLNSPSQYGMQAPHELSRFRQSVLTPRTTSPSTPDSPTSAVPSRPPTSSMDSSRGGLPRPSALTLPPPDVGFAAPSSTTTATTQQLPPPPSQWQNSDDAMHHWLRAKTEEDRRKQEEEKTRQETLRLEQRRVEQSMLRDSLRGGVPPHIIPLIFAGICQNGLPQPVLELTQQYLAQIAGVGGTNPSVPPQVSHSHSHSHSSSYSQRPSMHTRQDSRSGPSSSYPSQSTKHVAPPPPPPNILLSQNVQPNASAPPTPQPPGRRSLPSGPPDTRSGVNPFINHGGAQQPQSGSVNMGNVQYAPGSSVPGAPPPRRSDSQARRSPPSLYFHHWVPPPGKGRQESPAASSISRRLEQQTPPGRKRKASGPHQPAPAPSSRPPELFSGVPHISRPGSPRIDARHMSSLGHRHRMSDTGPHGGPSPEHSKAEHARRISTSYVAPTLPGYMLSSGASQNSADQRGRDASAPEGAERSFPRTVQCPYASSVETGARDSDLEGSSHQSPTSDFPLASV
ncbi:hypothetical protein BJY04DRAFT_193430 [Aspergillus karnatakaensis]|uniref:uncharacterized protein n=1 Tax=Aspergillus karnatakaensis TaxID=1810916 RepID=UPI003CCCB084